VENRLPLPSEIANPAVSQGVRNAGVVVAGSALVALSSHISLPLGFTPVPLTLQPFAVVLLGMLLAPRLAAATLGAYLLEGAMGLPVFAPGLAFGAGMAHLLGPTGGYLMSYPAAAALIAYLWRRSGRGFSAALLSAAAGNAVILLCGFAWLVVWTHGAGSFESFGPFGSLRTTFAIAVLPFLPGDALKVVAAAAIAKGLERVCRSR
jgi:biotin transport system substrate-specific component